MSARQTSSLKMRKPGACVQTLPVSRASYDPAATETLVSAVVRALADASGCPADELGVRLYDAIDPDALAALFRPTRRGAGRDTGRVAFVVGEFEVEVHADGRVLARPAD